MSWIKGEDFDFNSFLFMERFQIRMMFGGGHYENQEYLEKMALALKYNPVVKWYMTRKCPERAEDIEKTMTFFTGDATPEEVRKAEIYLLEKMCDWVVYANPEIMDKTCDWIYKWDKSRLFELADFTDKIVLDVGSGSGRLAFAAAKKAAWVYASEPVDMLREYLRDKIKRENIKNMRVVDGSVGLTETLPYPDDTFDIVMSAHVVGDYWDAEIAELTRVCKPGGWLLDCPGGNSAEEEPPDESGELSKRGWEAFSADRYRKQVFK